MTSPRFDLIGALAALCVLLAVALSPSDALVGVALASCWLALAPRPSLVPGAAS